jgi:hypothetical protein
VAAAIEGRAPAGAEEQVPALWVSLTALWPQGQTPLYPSFTANVLGCF